MNKILICIPTFYRNKSLIECLNSIKKLEDIGFFDIKVLIVDNTTSNNSYKIIKKYKTKNKFKILQENEKKRGIVNARNRCLKISRIIKPQFIAFIDDDCKVDKNWLRNIFKLLNKVNADIVTGPQKYKQNNKGIENNYSLLFEKNYKNNIVKVKWAASNNVFFKCSILKNMKNISFDKNLNKFGIGEDQLFFSLINKAGYKIYWSKNIFVTEEIHSHRTNIEWVKERSKRLGILGHYLDIKLNGIIFGYLINYLKSFYLLFLSIFGYFNFLSLNRPLNYTNNFFRFYGKLIGPFAIKKIKFSK